MARRTTSKTSWSATSSASIRLVRRCRTWTKSELKKKLNGVFQVNIEDVVKLAMNNGVTFIPVFRQFFPFFYDNLLEVNPNMNNEEFKLCALLKLGFTTKDIAEYNHLAVRTVQGRKNRLRKSFNIPSDTDLYIWIENF